MSALGHVLKSMNVLGLNSGTSMDAIDAGLFRIGPQLEGAIGGGLCPPLKVEFLFSELVPFEPEFKGQLESFVARGESDLRTMCLLNSSLGEVFAAAALKVVRQVDEKGLSVDLIGSHGQTIWHEPRPSQFWGLSAAGTLQLGDPAYVAARTGVTTVGDFRTYDMAFGGQGAPLVSFADEVLFGHSGEALAVLNLGGIANITVLSPSGEAIMAFDTGPANVLIDEAMRILFGREFDEGGAVAGAGTVNEAVLSDLLKEEYFHLAPPKTTGRELFGRKRASELVERLRAESIGPEDIVATLTALTARSIADAYKNFVASRVKITKLVLGGGGAENPTLTSLLQKYWDGELTLYRHEDYGISTKFKEALLFALLAYTTYFSIPNNVPSCTGASRRVCLGKIVKA
ncbi:MAG TPA: anhydro-N-acetylmuramic acid kinase [Candidatus Obscuribacter sp.]|nr:anhydro-N-acetylmuramic acid kinase [Candidatus Obscuribacter sp.]HMY53914.1 anhydro-N-acetylmuramic acid kinase [Candidatus Obscuribacter sp.]HNA72882.1 anhydro-N-acetylmuramic acid kinase [Candidatus Obscuribacter sp.]HNB17266.1 anhydro-N-acetylmuramic acid kinase [Candidatus Obscuribacter sp.]HNG73034.1 anhydro-N-acetylmuramic acid kinase [Candidatus Obscuribacter sp.]